MFCPKNMKSEYHIIKSGSTEIHLVKYEPFDPHKELDYLTPDEQERMTSFISESRKMEFVATRRLRHQLFGFEHIHYDPHGAPYIKDEGFISISHTKDYVAIAMNKDYQVGLDLEAHRPNITRLCHKFLNDYENSIFDSQDYIEITKVWSAKEALYKLAGRKQILFREHLLLDRNADKWSGEIVNPDERIYVNLDIFDRDNIIISVNNSPVRIEETT